MNRKMVTSFLSNLLITKKLQGIGKYWASEVSIDYGSTNVKRVDFMQFMPPNQCSVGAIEKGQFICYEIKSCREDVYSGNGLNFLGEQNYIVTTMECYKDLIADRNSGKLLEHMAAAAICGARGGSKEQMGHACAMALKNLMGLVCDPVAGLVEVPCVKRNVGGAVNALAAADMALAGIISQIPVDQVIDAMGEVGIKMDVSLRETSLGGVAVSPRGVEIAEKLGM